MLLSLPLIAIGLGFLAYALRGGAKPA
jgi:hypothetical protein